MKHRHFGAGLVAAALCLTAPGYAESPAPFPEFSAKRVKPPQRGTKKRITVQIETPVAAPQPVAQASAATQVPQSSYGWYWSVMSSKLENTGPGRLEPALTALSKGPGGAQVPAPRLQVLQGIATAQGIEILKATVGTNVSPALVLAVIAIESAGRTDAVSSAGAQGLMQLMPATAERFGVSDALVAAENIKGGVAFLDFLMTKFGGDPILVLAGYNAGENSLAKHDGVPPYPETRDYVPKVLAAYKVAKGLCLTPPEMISDGCVFMVNAG